MGNHRMRFIMQEARLADEVGWLEHESELALIAGADLSGQAERLRQLATRINTMAERITQAAAVKEEV